MGKWIGAFFGWLFAGPLGLLLGLYIGHLFDQGRGEAGSFYRMHHFKPWTGSAVQVQAVFFESTFQIMGAIAKSDGRVSEREIAFAREMMQKMQLTSEQIVKAMMHFNEGKSDNFDSEAALKRFGQATRRHRSLIQMFLEIQLQGAMVEGKIVEPAYLLLKRCCVHCGVPAFWIDHIAARVYAQQGFEDFFGYGTKSRRQYSRSHSQHRSRHQRSSFTAESDYSVSASCKILGVQQEASIADIKKAYRKLMSEHHPDKLAAKGLPPEMMKLATEKTQQIRQAYETIMRSKGEKV